MYLAIALKQFVLNVIGNMKTQWTWKQCLQFAIKNAMNDVLAQCRHLFELFNPGTLAQEVCTQSILLLQSARCKECVSPFLPGQS